MDTSSSARPGCKGLNLLLEYDSVYEYSRVSSV